MRIVAVFFFFQQKTAYEMRISDWSSDVCSSDLGQPRQTRVYPGTAADGGDAAGHRGVRGGASDPARCDRLRCGQTDRAGAPGLIWQPIPSTKDGGEDNRSEEHTSALQSLMSISYAVFFLTKKNSTQRKNVYQ